MNREARLYMPVRRWFQARGFTCYPERPHYASSIDMVARKGDLLVAVELKRSLTDGVLLQASRALTCCDQAYVAVGTWPRDLSRCGRCCVGLLSVNGNLVVERFRPLSKRKWPVYEHHHRRMLRNCTGDPGDYVGGKPCLRGEGPAQHCLGLVEEYRGKNPRATWKDVFTNVPNHYCSAKSMAQSLGTARQMRELKKLRAKAV